MALHRRELGDHREDEGVVRQPELVAEGLDLLGGHLPWRESLGVDTDAGDQAHPVVGDAAERLRGREVLLVDGHEVVGPSRGEPLHRSVDRVLHRVPTPIEVEAMGRVDHDRTAVRPPRRPQRQPSDESGDGGVDVHDVVRTGGDNVSNMLRRTEEVRRRERAAAPADVEAAVEPRRRSARRPRLRWPSRRPSSHSPGNGLRSARGTARV